MKKKISYAVSWVFFEIGDTFYKIGCLKHKGKFYFDRKGWRLKVGGFLANQYQSFMKYSVKIQEWGGQGVWGSADKASNS